MDPLLFGTARPGPVDREHMESKQMTEHAPSDVLSEHIADVLRSEILRGQVRPGERIRQEDIARRFDASRFPVREALRILEVSGLVTVRANRGAWVNALTQDECIELYRVRESLEPLLLEDSVPNLTAETIEEIEDLLGQLANARDLDADSYVDLDRRFHALTYTGSTMETVKGLVQRLIEMTNFYRRAYRELVAADSGRDWILQYDHELIVDAIHRRDAVEAAATMRLHTRRARMELAVHPELFAPESEARRKSDPML